ncbi:hypothetical protein HS088_TW19G00559 [Tripterygium wilfordii]|uniref:Uncharacterized protein n=1 Tax=Tripterygium wilfordii TaxID=458696 RepID=A0A7J7CB45_TRIWF|nr:hypothetical protein HS088_TW19G00559 [Tripterygium wilfordii]
MRKKQMNVLMKKIIMHHVKILTSTEEDKRKTYFMPTVKQLYSQTLILYQTILQNSKNALKYETTKNFEAGSSVIREHRCPNQLINLIAKMDWCRIQMEKLALNALTALKVTLEYSEIKEEKTLKISDEETQQIKEDEQIEHENFIPTNYNGQKFIPLIGEIFDIMDLVNDIAGNMEQTRSKLEHEEEEMRKQNIHEAESSNRKWSSTM